MPKDSTKTDTFFHNLNFRSKFNTKYDEPPCSINSGIIMHIALQGCLRVGQIAYGLTSDTGGHIRYLLELVEALADHPEVKHQIIVTRAFEEPELGEEYARPLEKLQNNITLWRCKGKSSRYLPKEELWKDLDCLTDNLSQRLLALNALPGFIHAHYADAGIVASKLKNTLGIPYAFTAHSLGAVKGQVARGNRLAEESLKRRIRQEQLAIDHADMIIASSRQEVTSQYGLYQGDIASKAVVNPPGCNLKTFQNPDSFSEDGCAEEGCAEDRWVKNELSRFLREPERPCLLAIARPVVKKNLMALVKAYGENAELRAKTNLVIFAGTREDLSTAESEAAKVWRSLFDLIDYYDLYGKVALPKTHSVSQVPAIYRWAVERQGLFVNPALIEPFGLTLLEAAAAGLPVVATREGGPADILECCKHGVLVDPLDTQAIANACNEIISDSQNWMKFSNSGMRNIGYYSWERHAHKYMRDLHGLLNDRFIIASRFSTGKYGALLATDMDGTLLGTRKGLIQLETWLYRNPAWLYVVATGRTVRDALYEMNLWGARSPDFIVADVGSSLYILDDQGEPLEVKEWRKSLERAWDRNACQLRLNTCDFLELQPPETQSPYKLSYFTDQPGAAALVERHLFDAGLLARVTLSHGHLLDVLPIEGGKSNAVRFLTEKFKLARSCVVTAGDSGNDEDLLRHSALGIIVANHTVELAKLYGLPHIYWAKSPSAGGIVEGLQFFEKQRARQVPDLGGGTEKAEPIYAAAK